MDVEDVVAAYANELQDWDYFSDSQRAYCSVDKRIVVCLRNYNWYITKERVPDAITAVKALFEIDWIAEYDDCEDSKIYIETSKYWKKY